MFTNFYCKLKLQSELRQPHGHGEKILILYHARARREWFDAARLKNLFDISVIDEDWMVEAHKEMWDNVHTQEIRKVEEKVTSNPTLKERNHAHQIWPTHPHPTSHYPMLLSLHTMPHSPRRTMPHLPHRIMPHLPHHLITHHPPSHRITASLLHCHTTSPPLTHGSNMIGDENAERICGLSPGHDSRPEKESCLPPRVRKKRAWP